MKSGVNEATELLLVYRRIYKESAGCLRTITSNIRTRHIIEGNPSAFETFKDNLQQLPLLWVHIRSLSVVNAKELVVKVPDVFLQKAPAQCYRGRRFILAPMKAVNVKP